MPTITPFLCALAGVIVANLPVTFVGGVVPAPLFALMPVYFWCLVRPDLMTPAAALVIGIAEDVRHRAIPYADAKSARRRVTAQQPDIVA